MEFEIRYNITKKFFASVYLRQTIWLALSPIPILYLGYFISAIIYYALGHYDLPPITFQIWFIVSVLFIVICIQFVLYLKALRKDFKHTNEYYIFIKFDNDGFHYETELGTSFLKWEGVSKTKRTSIAFMLHLRSGIVSIPIDTITEEQMRFIEQKVYYDKRAV